jgi:hypothetical protein
LDKEEIENRSFRVEFIIISYRYNGPLSIYIDIFYRLYTFEKIHMTLLLSSLSLLLSMPNMSNCIFSIN